MTVSRLRAADHSSIQDAIDAAPNNSLQPVVIEILDSLTYEESLLVDNRSFPNSLVIQAAEAEMPVIAPPAGDALRVTATTVASTVRLDGLVLSGGDLRVEGDAAALTLRFVTADPDSVALRYLPAGAGSRLTVSHAILGETVAGLNVAAVSLSDSILRHPLAELDDTSGHVALASAGEVELERVSLLGELAAHLLPASNSILVGGLHVVQPRGELPALQLLPARRWWLSNLSLDRRFSHVCFHAPCASGLLSSAPEHVGGNPPRR